MVSISSLIVLTLTVWIGSPPDSCLADEALRALDAGWERALLEGDKAYLDSLLAGDFVWVHDHASVIDSRESVLGRTGGDRSGMSSRVQSEVETRRLEGTGLVMGYTVVSRPTGSTRYRFMRTYVETESGCRLLANQTMVVPGD